MKGEPMDTREIADELTLKAEYYLYKSSDITIDKGKLKHFVEEALNDHAESIFKRTKERAVEAAKNGYQRVTNMDNPELEIIPLQPEEIAKAISQITFEEVSK